MNRFLQIVGIITLCCAALAIAGIGYGLIKSGAIKAEAERYTLQAASAFLPDWDMNTLVSRADEQFAESLKEQNAAEVGDKLRKDFGRLVQIKGSGCLSLQMGFIQGSQAIAECYVDAQFERGNAKIKMVVYKTFQGEWKLTGFTVNHQHEQPPQ